MMNFMKRAFLYVARKRGKTVLLFVFLLTMATFILTGLSIRNASEAMQRNLRESLGGRFDIMVDWEDSPYVVREVIEDNVFDEESGKTSYSYVMYSTEQFSPQDIAAIRETAGVRYCDAKNESLVPFEELALFPGTVPIDDKYRHRTKTYGVWSTEDIEWFTSGKYSLTEGRHITADDRYAAVISRDLADRSGLNVGDFITTRSYVPDEDWRDGGFVGNGIRVQIVGLFTSKEAEMFGETVAAYDKIQNRVFVDLQTDLAIEDSPSHHGFSAVSVTVEDPRYMEQVISDIRSLPVIDWNGFVVSTENGTYEKAAAPLASLSGLVETLLAVVIVVSAVILTLLLTLWTRNRVHETGILLAVGIRKPSVIGQYLAEVLLIAVAAFAVSFFTGSAAAGQIGSRVLEQGDIDIAVGAESLILLYLIGFAVIAVAVSAASVTVMRLQPGEILVKMS